VNQIFIGIILLIGLFPILAVQFEWDFFIENHRTQPLKDILGPIWMKRFYILLGFAFILVGLLCMFRIIELEVEVENKAEMVKEEVSEEDIIKELGLSRKFYYGIKVLADAGNQDLIHEALVLISDKAPKFFNIVTNNVEEIRQSKGPFAMGPVKSVPRAKRVEFSNFAGQYSKYNVAGFLVHEATHIVDYHNGLPYTKKAEIKARETDIALFRTLGEVEGRNYKEIIQFIENEIDMIRKGRLYRDLP